MDMQGNGDGDDDDDDDGDGDGDMECGCDGNVSGDGDGDVDGDGTGGGGEWATKSWDDLGMQAWVRPCHNKVAHCCTLLTFTDLTHLLLYHVLTFTVVFT